MSIQGNLEEVHSAAASFPDNDDLKGAAFALLRLQDTYDLSADNLAHGRIPGASRSNNMSGIVCAMVTQFPFYFLDLSKGFPGSG